MLLGPGLSIVFPAFKIWGAVYAIVAVIVDLMFLEPMAKRYQQLGAKIQELFDTKLLQIPWNLIRVGAEPDADDIVGLAKRITSQKKLGELQDWYAKDVGQAPIEYARLICQRTNMRRDAKLRRYYSTAFVILLAAVCLSGVIFGLIMQWDLEGFIVSVFLPFLPLGIKIWRESRKHADSAAASNRAKELLESNWRRALSDKVLAGELLDVSRRLQDELYDRRRLSPRVPEWWYQLFREDQELEMVGGAKKLVGDVLKALSAETQP